MSTLSRTQFPRKVGRPKGSGKGLPFQKSFPIRERMRTFWGNVKIGTPRECWPWMGRIEKETGYGKFCWNRHCNSAHRFAWISVFGEIPSGLFVCHKCDNRTCQNPSHLWLGTAADNNRDMFRKGRGSKPPSSAKITPAQVRLIRKLWIPYKMSVRQIATHLCLPYKACECAITKWKGIPWR